MQNTEVDVQIDEFWPNVFRYEAFYPQSGTVYPTLVQVPPPQAASELALNTKDPLFSLWPYQADYMAKELSDWKYTLVGMPGAGLNVTSQAFVSSFVSIMAPGVVGSPAATLQVHRFGVIWYNRLGWTIQVMMGMTV